MFKEMGDKPENQNENLDYLQHDAANMVSDTDALGKLKSGIKECPVCHARCFADMDVCYGCLHVFSEEENCAAKAKVESQKQMPPKEKHHLLQRIRWCLLRLIRVKMLTCSKL